VRKPNGKNNAIKKSAVHNGRPPSSTGRHRKEKILTSPAYIGGRNLRRIELGSVLALAEKGTMTTDQKITKLCWVSSS